MARAHADPPLNQRQLADALGISEGTIRKYEQSATPPMKPYEVSGFVERMTEISGLPREFFFADFDQLAGGIPADPEDQLERIEALVHQAVLAAGDHRAAVIRRLDAIEQRLADAVGRNASRLQGLERLLAAQNESDPPPPATSGQHSHPVEGPASTAGSG